MGQRGVGQIAWVTQDQLERARQISALSYLLKTEPDNLKPVGKEYRLRDHESLAVGKKGWYWHSRNIGSWSALDFLTDVRGYGFVEAVCMVLGESPQGQLSKTKATVKAKTVTPSDKAKTSEKVTTSEKAAQNTKTQSAVNDKMSDKALDIEPDRVTATESSDTAHAVQYNHIQDAQPSRAHASQPIHRLYTPTKSTKSLQPPHLSRHPSKSLQPPQHPPFTLPLRNKNNNRVIAYLQSREIDKDLIMDCINRGVLYESRYYHNAVFLGKDEHGKTRFAAMRSIVNNFMRDADGSDKRYGFVLPPENPNNNTAALYESPIDCLSHQTLCKQGYIPPFDGWRLSLGGTSTLALEHFLEQHPYIKHCLICTDADDAGNKAADAIINIATINGITTVRSPPIYGTDWNDALQAIKNAERTQGKGQVREQAKARDSPHL